MKSKMILNRHILRSIVLILSAVVWTCYGACSRRGIECPNYQVTTRHQDYEERLYPSSTWVSTTMEGHSLNDACSSMYKKLFSYVKGNNVKGMTLNTTTPVRTRIVPCHGATCATMFIMSFLIPSAMEDGPPYPTDPAVFIEKDPQTKYIVRGFDGRPAETEWIQQLHLLATLVKNDPTIDKSYYYAVWYDSPFQLFHRLNEVWMVKKDQIRPANGTAQANSFSDKTNVESSSHKSARH